MAIQIVTDSTCDISLEDQQKLGIHVVPLSIHFEDGDYLDGVDITREEFYEKLDKAVELPTTSMAPPQIFEEAFLPYVEAGDEVLAIMVSSNLSGTYQSASIAAESFPEGSVVVLDSRTASLSLHLLIVEACKYRDMGYTMAQMVEKMKELISKVTLFAALNTLKNLRKGGRISGTTAIVGEMLHIKPLITVTEGMAQNIGKARGMAAATKLLIDKVLALKPDFSHHVVFAYSGKADAMHKLMDSMIGKLGIKSYSICAVGGTVATYVGLNCMGFAFIQEEAHSPV